MLARHARPTRLAPPFALAIAAALALGPSASATVLPPYWSAPTRVFAHSNGQRHAMAVDGSGKVHIATEKGSTGIHYVTNASGSWTTVQLTSVNDREPAIAVDDGVVHIAFARREAGDEGIFTMSSDDGWTPRLRWGGDGRYPAMAVRDGVLKIAFRAPDSKLRYTSGTEGGSWTTELIDGSCCTGGPALALTAGGAPRVAYGDGTSSNPAGLKFAVRGSSGWSKDQAQGGRVTQVAMALNTLPGASQNAPHIAYVRDGSGPMHAWKATPGTSGTWWLKDLGSGGGALDLSFHSNEVHILFGGGGKLWLVRYSGGIYFTYRLDVNGKESKPQLGLLPDGKVVGTFARDGTSSDGVLHTYEWGP